MSRLILLLLCYYYGITSHSMPFPQTKITVKYFMSSSLPAVSWLILTPLPVLFLLVGLMGGDRLSRLPVIGPKELVRLSRKMFSHCRRTEPWFNLIQTGTTCLVRSSLVPRSTEHFTPAISVRSKLKSPNMRTKRGRCENTLKPITLLVISGEPELLLI